MGRNGSENSTLETCSFSPNNLSTPPSQGKPQKGCPGFRFCLSLAAVSNTHVETQRAKKSETQRRARTQGKGRPNASTHRALLPRPPRPQGCVETAPQKRRDLIKGPGHTSERRERVCIPVKAAGTIKSHRTLVKYKKQHKWIPDSDTKGKTIAILAGI